MSEVTETTGQAPANPGESIPAANPPSATPQANAAPQSFPDTKPADIAPAIPDKYEFKAPEGVELDTELLEQVSPVFKKIGLTQENAAELVNGFNEINLKLSQAREAAEEKAFNEFMAETAKANEAAIKKEWGNDYTANLAIAQRGIARFLSNDGKAKLDRVGLGNDPEFMKAFYQAGKMIQEDIPPVNGTPTNGKPTFAQALYS